MDNNLENTATKSEIFFCTAPESLGDLLLENLKNYPPTYKISQTIALALLRINKWYSLQVDMEESLASIIFDKSNRKELIREIIVRLAKIEERNSVPLLKRIISYTKDEFPTEYRQLAFAALLQTGAIDLTSTDEQIVEDIITENIEIDKILAMAKRIGIDNLKELKPTLLLSSLVTDEYIKKSGHKIHKLKAKDTTGRWAYYFILVESELEEFFLMSIDYQKGNIDLEDYGNVVASCYGEGPSDEVKSYLKEKYGFDI